MIDEHRDPAEVEQLKRSCHWIIDKFDSPAKLRRVYSFMNRIYCRPDAREAQTLNDIKETAQ